MLLRPSCSSGMCGVAGRPGKDQAGAEPPDQQAVQRWKAVLCHLLALPGWSDADLARKFVTLRPHEEQATERESG